VRQETALVAGQEAIARAEANQNMAALEQEAAEHDGRTAVRVTAPQDGLVTAFAFSVGQSVQAGTVLATVLPAGSALEAQLQVPSHAKASIERGQIVQLRIDAFPYQKYGLVAGQGAAGRAEPHQRRRKTPAPQSCADVPRHRHAVVRFDAGVWQAQVF
jgi:membrane fusion protein